MLHFIAPIKVKPKELEMQALDSGAIRLWNQEEHAKEYSGIPV